MTYKEAMLLARKNIIVKAEFWEHNTMVYLSEDNRMHLLKENCSTDYYFPTKKDKDANWFQAIYKLSDYEEL